LKAKLPIEHQSLVTLTSQFKNIPEIAVIKDFLIIKLLSNLVKSEWFPNVIFKGGTSLSKCYPNSIERFSEDIDLSYLPPENVTKSTKENHLKKIEASVVDGFHFEPIPTERNPLSKSAWAWIIDPRYRIKVELGANVMAKPFHKKVIRSYLHEYLEFSKQQSVIEQYELNPFIILTLDISRTFIDKVMAIKRHAYSGTLPLKVRHIYDVVQLWKHPEIKTFINDKHQLITVIKETKESDHFYFEKRNFNPQYDAKKPYDFKSWSDRIDKVTIRNYQSLHQDLLFSNQKQQYEEAHQVLTEINDLFQSIGE
jgi:predicted nucleotidyltransferase component of viral defense system